MGGACRWVGPAPPSWACWGLCGEHLRGLRGSPQWGERMDLPVSGRSKRWKMRIEREQRTEGTDPVPPLASERGSSALLLWG